MKDLGIKNVDLQKAMDNPMPNVNAMIKGGGKKLGMEIVPDEGGTLSKPPDP